MKPMEAIESMKPAKPMKDSPEKRSFSHRDTEYTEGKPRWNSELLDSKRKKYRLLERHLKTSVPLWQVRRLLRQSHETNGTNRIGMKPIGSIG